VVVVTKDRRQQVLSSLARLCELPERPPVILVDNGSGDGTADAVGRAFPAVDVVALPENRGAPARTVGVERAATPYVAFSDDDSWWAPGSLDRAADAFDANPRLGLVAAHVLVGPGERMDPICEAMATSPIPAADGLPGPPVLGFLACGAVVRRRAYLEAGGFDEVIFFLGEETLLAVDLARAGWELAYVEDVVAHHHPTAPASAGRRRLQARNALLTTWMCRPVGVALRATAETVASARRDGDLRHALVDAARAFPAAMARRRPVQPDVERRLRLLDAVEGRFRAHT